MFLFACQACKLSWTFDSYALVLRIQQALKSSFGREYAAQKMSKRGVRLHRGIVRKVDAGKLTLQVTCGACVVAGGLVVVLQLQMHETNPGPVKARCTCYHMCCMYTFAACNKRHTLDSVCVLLPWAEVHDGCQSMACCVRDPH